MEDVKYIGMDVHQATIVIAVLNGDGKLIMESIIETKAHTVLDFLQGLRGTLRITFEEGIHSQWLYDRIKPQVAEVIVCDPRKNKLLSAGNKGDRPDARKLAELLRAGLLTGVYHEEHGTRALKELARNYRSLIQDRTRVKNRLKAIYRGRSIACKGNGVYGAESRPAWLAQLTESGVRQRAEMLYKQLDSLTGLCQEAKRAMVAEGRKQKKAWRVLRSISGLGPVRVALLLAIVDTPHRFRTKRPFWTYVGLAVVTRTSAEYVVVEGRVQRSRKPVATRGLNRNYNRILKQVFKSAVLVACQREPWKTYYEALLAKGMKPEIARVTVARKLATITLTLWKKGERFDATKLNPLVK